MPTYKNITLSLRSSAAETQPLYEYPPPAGSPVQLEDPHQHTAAVYVPAMPKLTFWIAYHIKPPIPEEVGYFVFKLYMEGRLVVTWGVGEEDDWKGKAMFGLFENKEWRSGLERWAFAFGDLREEEGDFEKETDHRTRFLEVRVLRAAARRRIVREVMKLDDTEVGREGAGNVELFNAGMLQRDDPKRFYQYALRDTVAEPFAVFKYYYRTWGQLKDLGVLPDKEMDDEDEDEPLTATGNGFNQLNLDFVSSANAPAPLPTPSPLDKPLPELPPDRTGSRCSIRMIDESTADVGCMDGKQDEEEEEEEESFYGDSLEASPVHLKRLSFPPKTRIEPPQAQASRSPLKTPASSRAPSPAMTLSEYYDARSSVEVAEKTAVDGAAVAVEWARHTPSPVKRDESRQESREVASPVPNDGHKKAAGGGFFKGTIRRVVGRHKRSKSS